jgi:hypothetical protein
MCRVPDGVADGRQRKSPQLRFRACEKIRTVPAGKSEIPWQAGGLRIATLKMLGAQAACVPINRTRAACAPGGFSKE